MRDLLGEYGFAILGVISLGFVFTLSIAFFFGGNSLYAKFVLMFLAGVM